MECFSAAQLRTYLGQLNDMIDDALAGGMFRTDRSPTFAKKTVFGALDEMATNWILTDADAVVVLLVNGIMRRS